MFTLGRKIDIHYNTNRWILIIMALTSGIGIFTNGDLVTGIKIGVSVFLTWALTREVDPKREYAAFLTAGLALSSLFIAFEVDLMIIFYLLLLLRLVNNITGKLPTTLDLGIVFAIATYLSISMENSTYIFLFILGLFINKELKANKNIYKVFSWLSAGIFIFLTFYFKDYKYNSQTFSNNWIMGLYIISLILYFLFIYMDKDKSVSDDKGTKTDSKKILHGQIGYGISIGILFLFSEVAIGNMIVYLSAILGTAIYWAMSKFLKSEF